MPRDEHARTDEEFLDRAAKSVADIYISAAAFDATGVAVPHPDAWAAPFAAMRNVDGSYGKSAFDTATAVVTLLRIRRPVPDRDAAIRALRAEQTPEGGFAATGAADLPTTYRVMRALYMLKAKPDLTRLRGFIARCRNADGGYGPSPGQPSTGSATYNAAIILHWADAL
jgi:hypothetical protein